MTIHNREKLVTAKSGPRRTATDTRPTGSGFVGMTPEMCVTCDSLGATLQQRHGGIYKRPQVIALALKALQDKLEAEG